MRRFRATLIRLANLFRNGRRERDMAEELESHLQMHIEDNLRSGMSPDEARRQALTKLGGLDQVKEECRDTWGVRFINELAQDLRYGLRQLRRNPGFTAVAVITLALGIGANTAIFSVVNEVILRPLPYPQPDGLVFLSSVLLPGHRGREASYPDFLDWRARNHTFDKMAVFRTENFTLLGRGEPQHISGAIVSADLFSLLGVTPISGRSFLPGDDEAGAVSGTNAVIFSYGFWQRQFGADPRVLGRSINLGGHPFSVVGVAPPGFQFPVRSAPVDLWTTIAVDKNGSGGGMATQRGAHYLEVIARLKSGVNLAQAQAEMSSIVSAMNKEHPDIHPRAVQVVPMLDGLIGPARIPLLMLLGAVGCVLLIACVNVANLLLARASTRQREMSIRNALGASRGRAMRQVLTESTLLALFGGLLGLWLGLRGVEILIRAVPVDIPRLTQVGLDGHVLIFTAVVSLITGLLFGLAPALIGFRFNLAESLKGSGRGQSEGSHRINTHGALVVSEVALALVLLAGAGLLIKSFLRLENAEPGFDPHHILTLRLDSPATFSVAQQLNFFDQVIEGVRGLPGVRSASGVFGLPFSEINAYTFFEIEGRPASSTNRRVVNYVAVAPEYFRTLGIPFLEGRDFNTRDRLNGTPVAIVNKTLAARYFSGQNPVGQRIKPGISNGYGKESPVREIVGVVGNVKVTSLAAGPEPQCYVPLAQSPLGVMTLVVRADGDPLEMAPSVRNIVASANKQAPVYSVRSLDQMLAQSVAQPRFVTLLLGIFAGLAVLLAGIGLYGVISYSASQRTQEIGIRMALGAQKHEVLWMIIRQGLRLAFIGVILGIAGALALTRLLSSILYGVKPTDPLTFIAVPLILIAVALLACYIPARRASKVDPMVALRYE